MNTSAAFITIRSFPRRVAQFPRDDIEAKAARIAARLEAQHRLPAAPAVFLGWQPAIGHLPAVELYNVTADVSPNLFSGMTVSRATLEKSGYYVPAISPARINQGNADQAYGNFPGNS